MAKETNRSKPDLPGCLAAAGFVGAWTHDTATGRVVADRGVTELFGVGRPDACTGDPLAAYVEAIHPADRAGFTVEIAAAAKRGASIALQYRIRSGDGVRFLRDYGSFVLDDRDRPVRGQGIVIDATRTRNRGAPEAAVEVAALRMPDVDLTEEVTLLAEHVVAASEIARTLPSARLRALTDPLLWEVGRLLAWATARHNA